MKVVDSTGGKLPDPRLCDFARFGIVFAVAGAIGEDPLLIFEVVADLGVPTKCRGREYAPARYSSLVDNDNSISEVTVEESCRC